MSFILFNCGDVIIVVLNGKRRGLHIVNICGLDRIKNNCHQPVEIIAGRVRSIVNSED